MDSSLNQSPKAGKWIARPRKPRWLFPAVVLAGVGSQLPTQMVNLFTQGRGSGAFATLIAVWIILVLVLLGVWVWSALRSRQARADTMTLVDGDLDQYPVEVTIVAEGKRLGTDRGVVWFADGLIGFSGRASSFVLAPGDLASRTMIRNRGVHKALPSDTLVLRNAPKEAYIVVTPYRNAQAYRTRVRRFLPDDVGSEDERLLRHVMGSPPPSGERQWPPLEPYRETTGGPR